MGILNITPDSFSDGGIHFSCDTALNAALQMKEDGADILDVGAESTRPGATPVSVQQEMDRVLPVIGALQAVGLPLSLDSRRADVVQAAIGIGIDMVNDVSGFTTPTMQALLPEIAQRNMAVCIMHMQGEPQTMQSNPHYQDVVREVGNFLAGQRDIAMAAGLPSSQILLDPGFGFGKTRQHNVALFDALSELGRLGPLLVGVSRKRMLAELSEREGPAAQRLGASISAALLAAERGVSVLRVHDVRQTVDALRVQGALRAGTHRKLLT